MSLDTWQKGLASMILRGTIEDELLLSEEERNWLVDTQISPGFKVTCDIQKWWRKMRIRTASPLTIRVMENYYTENEIDAFIDEYISENLVFSQYYVSESLSFMRWLYKRLLCTENDNLKSILSFEEALLICKITPQIINNQKKIPDELVCGTTTRIIKFYLHPELLLSALLSRKPIPTAGTSVYNIVVSQSIPHYWREASGTEVALLELCQNPYSTSEIPREFRGVVGDLYRDHMLVNADKMSSVN